jgi:dTDP-glucose 4,6-dehydratase
MILVTGGAGFIGSNFVHQWIEKEQKPLLNLDKLTYAGHLQNLASLQKNPLHKFIQGDIADRKLIQNLLQTERPHAIVHFAAETHVDRSIHAPEDFVHTNVHGSFHLLDEARKYWQALPEDKKHTFRFLNVSTDEVFGSLEPTDPPATEEHLYCPNSPYSASKASFDHFIRAYNITFGFPAITTYCSNNFGPYQFPEKLIPLMIVHALEGKPLPLYGDGQQVRNWLYVGDHCEALRLLLAKGRPGERYNISSDAEWTNLALIHLLCKILDEIKPTSQPYSKLISHIKDRPGHDRRYALDSGKLRRELGWKPKKTFEEQLRETVQWYLHNPTWITNAQSAEYQAWIASHYA